MLQHQTVNITAQDLSEKLNTLILHDQMTYFDLKATQHTGHDSDGSDKSGNIFQLSCVVLLAVCVYWFGIGQTLWLKEGKRLYWAQHDL